MSTRSFYQGGLGNKGSQLNFTDPDYTAPVKGKSLWQTAPLMALDCEPFLAFQYLDDFLGFVATTGNWISTQATSGTATQGVLHGGTVALNSGATTQHQGIQIQKTGGLVIPAATKDFWFECRLQASILQGEFFFGLADIDTTVITAGAIHATDYIAITSITSDGVLLPGTSSASTVTTGTTIKTLVASTMVRLGFTVTSNTSVQFYVDGVATGAAITTNIPSVVLTPTFVSQAGSGAGANSIVNVDYCALVGIR